MLKRTKDRKVANHVTKSGNVSIANAFSLPSGTQYTCPGATSYCEDICYAGKLETMYPSFRAAVLHNLEQLKNGNMVELLTVMIQEFVEECDRKNAPKLFRIHADGDYFHPEYVSAWIAVMQLFPDVQFWSYTRVVSAAIAIHNAQLTNHALYFSADKDNIGIAKVMAARGILIAVVGDTFDEAQSLFPSFKCPENRKSIPLISTKGSACARCGICIIGRKSVAFSKKKGN